MNANRTNNLWCKKCLWYRCRCMLAPMVFKTRGELEEMFPPRHQYRQTMTMDDLRRNALESVIEELKERDE